MCDYIAIIPMTIAPATVNHTEIPNVELVTLVADEAGTEGGGEVDPVCADKVFEPLEEAEDPLEAELEAAAEVVLAVGEELVDAADALVEGLPAVVVTVDLIVN